VELHDSIAQNLTGAAFQIEAAKDAIGSESEPVTYLSCAEQILKSCRTELRRCIWDLRSNALEEPDFNRAILSTIHPVADGADVRVDFNVPRIRMSDTTAHAILRIIRELTANAVRHGQATGIDINGRFVGGELHISVSDNGCGFDPAVCPGADTGHFGLNGIRERIDKFDGTLSVDSSAGKGTRVKIRIRTQHAKPENDN
jgi:signal transduction histidine kinase